MNDTVENLTRAEKRRAFAEYKRREGYDKSKFLDFSRYVGVYVKPNKYVPHMGKKQRGLSE